MLATGFIWNSLSNHYPRHTEHFDINFPVIVKEEATISYGLPVRLVIPAIKVNAAVDYVGLTDSGDLDTPEIPSNVGWYKQGPRPGEVGSAVIDGHFGLSDNKSAVFDDLHKLRKGDKILSRDKAGISTTFIVTRTKTYKPTDDATAVFRSTDGKAHLNLITCQGDWNESQESYSTRLVVFADKE